MPMKTRQQDPKVCPSQVRKAARALLVQHKAQCGGGENKAQLFDALDTIQVQFSLRKIPEQLKRKPVQIELPHSMATGEACAMCLFVKEGDEQAVREALKRTPVEGLEEIIGLQKLRTDYKAFKDRRELVSQYDLFLCDDRILPMMTKVLGKVFYKVKKQPAPIRVSRKNSLAAQICLARDGTLLHMSHGCCWGLNVAHTSMTVDQISENVLEGVRQAMEHIPGKWGNIQSLHVRPCRDGLSLPIYNTLQSWDGADGEKSVPVTDEGSSNAAQGSSNEEPCKRTVKSSTLRKDLKSVAKRLKK